MKNITLFTLGLIILAGCSAPKYSYNFDYYDYNSGKRKAAATSESSAVGSPEIAAMDPIELEPIAESPLILKGAVATASASSDTPEAVAGHRPETFRERYAEMSKQERREFRKTVKAEIKKFVKERKADNGATADATKAMDSDLRLAIIFGAVALTLSFFGGVNSVFWIISVVSLVIAVVFFIKWLVRQ